jgi:hypothetical protein
MSATALMERYAQRKQKRDQNILDTADVLRDVEKLPFSQNSQKLGDRKCLGGRSKSFVELPDAF